VMFGWGNVKYLGRRLGLFDALSHNVLSGGGLRGEGRVKLYPTHRIERHRALLVVCAHKTPLCLFIVVAAARPQAHAVPVLMTLVGVLSRMVSAERVARQIVDGPQTLRVFGDEDRVLGSSDRDSTRGDMGNEGGVVLHARCCLPILGILEVLEAVDASPTRTDPLAKLGGLIFFADCTENE
jgi:hypothetical protein